MGGAPGEGVTRIDTWYSETHTGVFLGDTPGIHPRIVWMMHRPGEGDGREGPGAHDPRHDARKRGREWREGARRYNSHGAIGAVLCPGDY